MSLSRSRTRDSMLVAQKLEIAQNKGIIGLIHCTNINKTDFRFRIREREREMAIQLNHISTFNSKHEKQPKPPLPTTKRRPALHVNAVSSGNNARQLIQSQAIRAIRPKEAVAAINSDGFTLLDIRPVWETEKARVKGSLNVPLFIEDKDNSPLTLLKKWVHFGYIGLWTGQYFTTMNPDFLLRVEEVVPDKDSKLLVACGEGLR